LLTIFGLEAVENSFEPILNVNCFAYLGGEYFIVNYINEQELHIFDLEKNL